jgi:hypothetical protein
MKSRNENSRIENLFWDLFIYFKLGHSGFLAFLINVLTFLTVQYRLLISSNPTLAQLFGDFLFFAGIFGCVYFPLAIVIGFILMKRGENIRRPRLDPYSQGLIEAQFRLNTGMMFFIKGNEDKALEELNMGMKILQSWMEVKNE